MRQLTITTQESGARLREPGKTLVKSIKSGEEITHQRKDFFAMNSQNFL